MDSWENRRGAKRKYMLFKIPAYDAQTRRFLGLVQDITESGVQLFGVKMDTNLTKTLIIQASDYIKSAPLHFNAICKWTRRENPQGYYVSGFEIIEISEEAKRNLVKLMDFVTLG
ncbi:MAG TPA: PilZ domain-containing protein [Desulfomonilaceae bacterium]|nr:PilZ domain-containing protein [Desulfomonilaceae bacterium]